MPLSRDNILSAQDITTETVAVPEWGGEVLVRSLTGRERDAWEDANLRRDKDGQVELVRDNARARLCALSLVDESGKRLFSDAADLDALGKKSARALQRVYEVAMRLGGFSSEEVDDAEKK